MIHIEVCILNVHLLLQITIDEWLTHKAFLRLRSKKHEIMIAPDKDYILIVLQNPAVGV